MKKFITLLLVLLLIGCAAFAETQTEGLTADIMILFTSDVHCGVESGFGYAGLAAVRDAYAAAGDHVLLVDNGDAIQGEMIGAMTTGETIIELMNKVGYDVATIGNHEFDYGVDRFLELTEKADFPYVSVNFNKEGETLFDPYVMKEFDGVKLAFLGVTTPETLTSSTPRNFMDEDGNFIYGFFQDETGETLYAKIQEAADQARAEGADYVILLAHLGNEEACRPYTYADIIENTTGIDAVLDGHSHDRDHAEVLNKEGKTVLRQGCGTKMEGIGYLKIAKDGTLTAGVTLWPFSDLNATQAFGLDTPVAEAVEEAASELNESLSEVVARSEVTLTIYDPTATDAGGKPVRIIRNAETNLGDLCADAFRDVAGTDIALVSGGGIRVSIEAGEITWGDILKVYPFGNTLCVCEATGQQILDALEFGVKSMPSEFGGFQQVSGITFDVDLTVPTPVVTDENGMASVGDGARRVSNVRVNGTPIDPEKTYTVASNNYLIKNNGDGCTAFDGCRILQDEVMLDYQALTEYIKGTLGGVVGEEYADPYGHGRINVIAQ